MGIAKGGEPGGGEGHGSNSSFAAGGGGGFSAVYREGPLGTEVLLLAGGGGGGGTRDGRPGGESFKVTLPPCRLPSRFFTRPSDYWRRERW